jgi:hypothetical protein
VAQEVGARLGKRALLLRALPTRESVFREGDLMTRRLIVVLGDQLTPQISSLSAADKKRDVVLMCEVWAEATYVRHHKKKIAFIFSCMRHFAMELREKGWTVDAYGRDRKILKVRRTLLWREELPTRLEANTPKFNAIDLRPIWSSEALHARGAN